MLTLLLLLFFNHFHLITSTATQQPNVCTKSDLFYSIHHSFNYKHISETRVFLFYDINPGEGFNLRRDVYIRLAVFMRHLRQQSGFERACLVLPPFRRLYHWKSQEIDQSLVFWNHFFDLPSLKRYAPVLDIWEYFDEIKRLNNDNHVELDYSLTLQHYENMFENGRFIDRFEVIKSKKIRVGDNIFGYKNVTAKVHHAVSYQGSVKMLYQLLDELKPNFYQPHFSVLLNHAEIVLHDVWGNREFWRARRSMRFSKILTSIADEFRLRNFNSTDESDGVLRPANWQDEKSHRSAVGGDYVCAHIRRADFVLGREKTTPSLRSVGNQVKVRLKQLDSSKIFISSDCSGSEFKTLKSYLMRHKVYRYQPESAEQKNRIKDGGMAIIDQIICSHARYFIGTYESTFTYRIYEEREIMGFPKNSTFNTFCKNDDVSDEDCEKNSVWLIVH
ncbi:hypothetical protein HA402_008231 [Bradysia odoriphaga]|nr:hypothetical protein HA402_008231 [Bradysia odoriphaga]